MPFQIIRNDITCVKADAIVDTANPDPVYGSGTDAAIYHAAGAQDLLEARKKTGKIEPGHAASTPAFALKAKYIIHTVGPEWIDGHHREGEILSSCYRNCLELAESLGCKSIAFPLIATGVYGFPKDLALQTALNTIRAFLEHSEMNVILVVFERKSYQLASSLVDRVEAYIDEADEEASMVGTNEMAAIAMPGRVSGKRRGAVLMSNAPRPLDEALPANKKKSLEEAVSHLGESFQSRLLRMIDERGMSDPEVYKRANIDRKLFSKIRCSESYTPKKKTILALAIALHLNLDDTRDLLMSAGYALSTSSPSDRIVAFCMENDMYDIMEVNSILFQFNQPLLGN